MPMRLKNNEPLRQSKCKRNDSYESGMWDVRPTAGRTAREWTIGKMIKQTRIPTEQIGTRSMEAWYEANPICTHSRWFCSKICRAQARWTFAKGVRRALQSDVRLDGRTIHRHTPPFRGCSGKMANFWTSFLGNENQGYVSNGVCDDEPKIWSKKIDKKVSVLRENERKSFFTSETQ
jgi:hypothetical protein